MGKPGCHMFRRTGLLIEGLFLLCYSLFQAWVKNGESLKSKLGGIRGQWNTETNFQSHPPNLMKKMRTLLDYLISCRACVANIKIQSHSPEWICNLAQEDPKLWTKKRSRICIIWRSITQKPCSFGFYIQRNQTIQFTKQYLTKCFSVDFVKHKDLFFNWVDTSERHNFKQCKQRGIPLYIDEFDKNCLIASIYLDASRKQEVVLLVLCSRTKLFSMKYSMKFFYIYSLGGGGGVKNGGLFVAGSKVTKKMCNE